MNEIRIIKKRIVRDLKGRERWDWKTFKFSSILEIYTSTVHAPKCSEINVERERTRIEFAKIPVLADLGPLEDLQLSVLCVVQVHLRDLPKRPFISDRKPMLKYA